MSEEKNAWNPLIKIHDNGEFQSLIGAVGFETDPNQAELLLALAKWVRMVKNKEKIPPLTLSNINKFKQLHYNFLVEYRQVEREQMMKKAQEAANKRAENMKVEDKVVPITEGK